MCSVVYLLRMVLSYGFWWFTWFPLKFCCALLMNRFNWEIPHFGVSVIRFSSKHSGGWGSLVWKFPFCKFTWKYLATLYFLGESCSLCLVFLYVFMCTLQNALLVFVCEMLIDIIKHSFLAKFNDIKPIAYSEFLEDLCKQVCAILLSRFFYFLIWYFLWVLSLCQRNLLFFSQTLNMQTENGKKNLTFVPLAPACVVSTNDCSIIYIEWASSQGILTILKSRIS